MNEKNTGSANRAKILKFFIPPPKWQFSVIILSGILVGLFFYIFYISNAVSYLSDKPTTCINCHVMYPEYSTWRMSSHGRNTVCNDCHVPHDNFINKYMFKASDGLRHSTIFTLRAEPQVIKIKDAGAAVVQENCIRCHQNNVHRLSIRNVTFEGASKGNGPLCWHCHREVPHGRVKGLRSTPFARIPYQEIMD